MDRYFVTRKEKEAISKFLKIRLPINSIDDSEAENRTSQFRAMIRLFGSSYGIEVLYSTLLGILKRKSPMNLLKGLKSYSALRLALAVSTYSAAYRFSLQQLRQLYLSKSSTSFLAGLIASPTLLFEPPGQRRVSISLYVLAAAVQGFWRNSTLSKFNPGVLVFSCSQAVLLHAFVYHSTQFPSSLGSFILRFSTDYLPIGDKFPKGSEIVNGIRIASKNHYPKTGSKLISELEFLSPILNTTVPNQENLVCAFLHPAEASCKSVAQNFARKEFLAAAKFFTFIAVISSLIRYKKTLKDPLKALKLSISTILKSSLSLAISIGTAWSTICLFQQIFPNDFLPTKRFMIQGFLAGLPVFLTGASRAADLANYTGKLALQTWFEILVKQKKMISIQGGELIYFGLSMASLMAIFESNPSSITSSIVRFAFKKVAGEDH